MKLPQVYRSGRRAFARVPLMPEFANRVCLQRDSLGRSYTLVKASYMKVLRFSQRLVRTSCKQRAGTSHERMTGNASSVCLRRCTGTGPTMTVQSGIVERRHARLSPFTDLVLFVRRAFSAARGTSLLTLLLPAFILAACGGGGGGGGGTGGVVGGTTTTTISGTISPASLGAGVRVTLSGASSATATADASGNYSFPGLANGSYTVTASGTSLTFSPASTPVTLSGSNATANFTAASSGAGGTPPTRQISGTISPTSLGANVTVTLTNTATSMTAATTTTDTSGNFTFPALADGSYAVMPSSSSLTFSPTDWAGVLNGSNATGVNFTASTVSGGGGGGAPTTWAISGAVSPLPLGAGVQVALTGASTATMVTNSMGAFNFTNLTNGTYTLTPSGSSLNFNPASRTVTVNGGNITNAAFTASTATYTISGTITSGPGVTVSLGGAASQTVITNGSGVYSFTGVANGSYTVTPSSSSLNFTPGSQAVTVSGANVTGLNFAASTPPPATYTISGTIASGPGLTVSLSGAASRTTTTNTSGFYSFTGVANGSYTVAPSSSSLIISPTSQSVTVSGANRTNINFTASPPTYTISGTITSSPSSLSAGVQVALSGAGSATTTTNSSGAFTFTNVANGAYTVTPSGSSLNFSPTSRSVTVSSANVTGVTFTASTPPPVTYTISGTISPSSLGAGATVSLSGASTATATANSSGVYTFTGLANGAYTVTPSGASLNFTPANRSVTVSAANVSNVDFTTSSSSNVFFFDDFNGASLGSAWTALNRSGPGSQSENLCNKPEAVTVSGGILTITTSATQATCGDAVTAPSTFPYTSGSIQWTNLNFTCGTVEIRAKFPARTTGTWPALWLLGSNCQAANIVNGSEAVPFMGCPAQGDAAYREIDMVECDTRSWCHLVLAQGTFGWGQFCDFPVDANWHVFSLGWNASTLTVSVDGTQVCSKPNDSIKGPVFLILQTQTTYAWGVGGQVNNAALPTTFQIDYVRVTQ